MMPYHDIQTTQLQLCPQVSHVAHSKWSIRAFVEMGSSYTGDGLPQDISQAIYANDIQEKGSSLEKVETLTEENANIRAIAKEQPNMSLNNL